MKYEEKQQKTTFGTLAPMVDTPGKFHLTKQLEGPSPFFHKTVEWTLTVGNCNREEPNLTTRWICFFDFNLCLPLLLFTKRILSVHNGLPRGTLFLCLNVKPKCLCSGKHTDSVHLWMAAIKKKLTHPLPEAGHSRGYSQNLWPFYFTSSSPPHLCAIKQTGIQTPIRRLF